jgi:hypothetical protein
MTDFKYTVVERTPEQVVVRLTAGHHEDWHEIGKLTFSLQEWREFEITVCHPNAQITERLKLKSWVATD